MNLREKQSKFVRLVVELILFAEANGYELTFGDAYRSKDCSHGHPNSLHRKRLAIDFNLFRDGQYLRATEDHAPLGQFWESLGGSWGGRFGDGNHYSLEHRGMR